LRGISQLLALLILAASVLAASSLFAVWYLSVVMRYTDVIEYRTQHGGSSGVGNCSVSVVVENDGTMIVPVNLVLIDPPFVGGEWNYSDNLWIPVGEESPEPVYLEPGEKVVLVIRNIKATPSQELVVIVKAVNGRIMVSRVKALSCQPSP